MANRWQRNELEIDAIRKVARSGADCPLVMLNLNRYCEESGYPSSDPYLRYLNGLKASLALVGARIESRSGIIGQFVGQSPEWDEVISIWYPSHAAFLHMLDVSSSAEKSRLRKLTVQDAVILRCAPVDLMLIEGGADQGS